MSFLQGQSFYLSPLIPPVEYKKIKNELIKNGAQVLVEDGEDNPIIFKQFKGADFERFRLGKKKPIFSVDFILDSIKKKKKFLVQPGIAQASCCMEGINISCTGIPDRDQYHELVSWMGGNFSQSLSDKVTHLIATTSGSHKYKEAIKHGIPIIHPNWIIESWNSKTLQPAENFKLPIFVGCVICVTGLSSDEKREIEKKIKLNGGFYEADLVKNKVTHLLTPRAKGNKYCYAKKWGIHIVNLRWFYDSIECKARQEENLFPVEDDDVSNARIATLLGSEDVSKVSESTFSGNDLENSEGDHFLEGLKILLIGFIEQEEKTLAKLISSAGGTRLLSFDDRVTHIIADKPHPSLLKFQQKTKIVTPQWLKDCLQDKFLVPEGGYFLNLENISSEILKKSNDDQTKSHENFHVDETESAQQVNGEDNTLPWSPYKESSVFEGVLILLRGWNTEEKAELRKKISENGGLVFDEEKIPSFINFIVSPHGTKPSDNQELSPSPPLVSRNWVEMSLREAKLMDPENYFPLPFPTPYQSMKSLYICVSGFQGEEREHLINTIQIMGSVFSDRLIRKKTTHLICKEAKGEKYQRALEWKSCYILRPEWVFACAKEGYNVLENNFLLEGTEAPIPQFTSDKSISKSENGDSKVLEVPLKNDSNSFHGGDYQELDEMVKEDPQKTGPPFAGFTIYMSKKIPQERQTKLEQLISQLGGSYTYKFDSSITHYLFEGKMETCKEFKVIKRTPVKMVSPVWVLRCFEEFKRLPEIDYPTTMNPNMSLGIIGVSSPGRILKRSRPKSPIREKKNRKKSQKSLNEILNTPKMKRRDSESFSPPSLDWKAPDYLNRPPEDIPLNERIQKRLLKDKNIFESPKSIEKKDWQVECSPEEPKYSPNEVIKDTPVPETPQMRTENQSSSEIVPNSVKSETNQVEDELENKSEDNLDKIQNLMKILDSKIPPLQSRNFTLPPPTFTNIKKVHKYQLENDASPVKKKARLSEDENEDRNYSDDDGPYHSSQVVLYVNQLEQKGRKKILEQIRSGQSSETSIAEIEFLSKTINMNFPTDRCESSPQNLKPPLIEEIAERYVSQEKENLSPQKKKNFHILISNAKPKETSHYEDIILKLNGVIETEFSNQVTHVVTPSISSSMKCFAACVSAKWILKPSFLEKSLELGYFDDEQFHLWTEEDTIHLCPNPDHSKIVAQAFRGCLDLISKRRKETNNPNAGLFTGFKAILKLHPDFEPKWRAIIEAGDGRVVSLDENLENVTHVFVDAKEFKSWISQKNLQPFIDHSIPVYTLDYLKQFIFNVGAVTKSHSFMISLN